MSNLLFIIKTRLLSVIKEVKDSATIRGTNFNEFLQN